MKNAKIRTDLAMPKNLLFTITILLTQITFGQKAEPEPNVSFSKKYIKKHKGKTTVETPEVSELVNIIMALHKDTEKEDNMFDSKTVYYQKLKYYGLKTHRLDAD